jgi:hypothetical protein
MNRKHSVQSRRQGAAGAFLSVMARCRPVLRSLRTGAAARRDCSPAIWISKELIGGSRSPHTVFHPGGLFYTGDAHAVQGDGGINGTAIETANTAYLPSCTRPNTLSRPRVETATHIAIGLAPGLDDAMRQPTMTVDARGDEGFRSAHDHAAREHRDRLSSRRSSTAPRVHAMSRRPSSSTTRRTTGSPVGAVPAFRGCRRRRAARGQASPARRSPRRRTRSAGRRPFVARWVGGADASAGAAISASRWSSPVRSRARCASTSSCS